MVRFGINTTLLMFEHLASAGDNYKCSKDISWFLMTHVCACGGVFFFRLIFRFTFLHHICVHFGSSLAVLNCMHRTSMPPTSSKQRQHTDSCVSVLSRDSLPKHCLCRGVHVQRRATLLPERAQRDPLVLFLQGTPSTGIMICNLLWFGARKLRLAHWPLLSRHSCDLRYQNTALRAMGWMWGLRNM